MPRNHPHRAILLVLPLSYHYSVSSYLSLLIAFFRFAVSSISHLSLSLFLAPRHNNVAEFNNSTLPRDTLFFQQESLRGAVIARECVRSRIRISIDWLQIFIKHDVWSDRQCFKIWTSFWRVDQRNRFRDSLKFHVKFIGLSLSARTLICRRSPANYKLY